MLHVLRWDSATKRAEIVSPDRLPAAAAEVGEAVYWIDLDDPTPEEEERVLKHFHAVHPLTLEDITKLRREPTGGAHFPKVEEFPDYLFVIVNPLPAEVLGSTSPLTPVPPREGGTKSFRHRPQLSAVITESVLITHHYSPLPCVAEGQKHLIRHAENLGRGPDYVFHLILDGIVDEYAPVVDRITDKLDRMEAKLFTRPSAESLARLLRIKRTVTHLRKTLILEREVLARLIRGEFRLVESREIVYYRNVYDHLTRYTELIEAAREMASDLMQTHLSASSNRLNEVMKALTMISTIGLVCGLIAGVYGMNFENLPGLKWEHGFTFALALMVGAAAVAFVWFKWKRWV
jgi:magnesium transporter